MTSSELMEALGQYDPEPGVIGVLAMMGAPRVPKIKRGERSSNLTNSAHGVEVTFTNSDLLDVPKREYPEGAMVFSSVRFYGDGHAAFKKYVGQLPYGIEFGMKLADVRRLLGKTGFESEDLGLFRWDLTDHCVFVDCGSDQAVNLVTVQLPVA